jgi:rare lipoprotein A
VRREARGVDRFGGDALAAFRLWHLRWRLPEARPAPATPPVPPAPAVRSGGYYLDDGPGDNPPPNLEAVPDAIPRMEPLHRGALRPYTVMGRNYMPMTAVAPYRARGVASWYGRRYHGKLTSNGETYDMYGMSAAHPTLPLPSYVRVTSVANGKTVIVRVNDRGPFIDSRLIDLSYTAAHKLGVISGGSAMVDVELILPGAPAPVATAQVTPVPVIPAPAASVPAAPVPAATVPVTPVPAVAAIVATPGVAAALPNERTLPMAAESSGVYLQLAAFGSKENADAYASRLRADVAWLASQLQVLPRDGLFRVRAGPYANPGEARQTAERINQSVGVKPVVRQK